MPLKKKEEKEKEKKKKKKKREITRKNGKKTKKKKTHYVNVALVEPVRVRVCTFDGYKTCEYELDKWNWKTETDKRIGSSVVATGSSYLDNPGSLSSVA